jgi:hypothetical protein
VRRGGKFAQSTRRGIPGHAAVPRFLEPAGADEEPPVSGGGRDRQRRWRPLLSDRLVRPERALSRLQPTLGVPRRHRGDRRAGRRSVVGPPPSRLAVKPSQSWLRRWPFRQRLHNPGRRGVILRIMFDADDAVDGSREARGRDLPRRRALAPSGRLDRCDRRRLRRPGDSAVLQKHWHDRSAIAAVRGAAYVVASFPGRDQVADALAFATAVPGGGPAGGRGVGELPLRGVRGATRYVRTRPLP